jgi:sugar O-acyltransferase (sialic acid O-acetyltransferase NeuD family)
METVQEIYIVGAGGAGKEVLDTIEAMNRVRPQFRIAGYVDDDPTRKGDVVNGVKVVGNTDDLIALGGRPAAVISVADPVIKGRLAGKLDGHVEWINAICPTANISAYATLGKGIVIRASVCVGANAILEDHVQVNALSSIGHDVRLGLFSSVMIQSALSGYAVLGRYGYIATGVTALPGVRIGENTHIGAGSVVTKDVPANVVAYGMPCRVIREREVVCDDVNVG